MTDPNYTYMALVVDRSGSMMRIRDDAEGALKALVKDQREQPGKLTTNLFIFDDEFEEIEPDQIDRWVLSPRGTTALYDAIGKAMTIVGQRLEKMPEESRPGKVMFAIITDGLNNSSREWTQPMVRTLVEQQQNKYGWQVIFTAANLDSHALGANLGMRPGQTMDFAYSGHGIASAGDQIMRSFSAYRSGAAATVSVPKDAS